MAKEINPATSNPNASAGASQHEAMINENQPAENLGPGIGEQQGAGRRGEVMARVFACNGSGRTYPPPRRRGRCPAGEKEYYRRRRQQRGTTTAARHDDSPRPRPSAPAAEQAGTSRGELLLAMRQACIGGRPANSRSHSSSRRRICDAIESPRAHSSCNSRRGGGRVVVERRAHLTPRLASREKHWSHGRGSHAARSGTFLMMKGR
jgi:hypothetical protein